MMNYKDEYETAAHKVIQEYNQKRSMELLKAKQLENDENAKENANAFSKLYSITLKEVENQKRIEKEREEKERYIKQLQNSNNKKNPKKIKNANKFSNMKIKDIKLYKTNDIMQASQVFFSKYSEEFKSNTKVKISSLFLASLVCFNSLKLANNAYATGNEKNGSDVLFDKIKQFTDLAKDPNSVSYDILGNQSQEEIDKGIPFIAYTVGEDEDINSIAQQYGVSVNSILKINKLISTEVKPGTNLILPKVQKINIAQKEEKTEEPAPVEEVHKTFRGIDVSEHQGEIDWETTKESIDYAIIRVCDFYNKDGNGNTIIDKQFKRNMEECNRLGIPVGVYSFTRANNREDAVNEAKYVLDAVKDYKLDYPIYFDIEAQQHRDMIASDLNSAIDLTEGYCKTIEDNNYYVGIYSSNSMLNDLTQHSASLAQYDKWIANFGQDPEQSIDEVQPKTIDFGSAYFMHQASSRATVPGIGGYVDVDFGYLDFPKIIEQANLNKPKQKTR